MNFRTSLATFATLDNNSEDYAFACGHLLQKIASTNGLGRLDLIEVNEYYQNSVAEAMGSDDELTADSISTGVFQCFYEIINRSEIIAEPFSIHRRKYIRTKSQFAEEEDYAKALSLIEKVVSSHSI